MYNNLPKHTGIYHIKDNVDQLQLHIQFRHVNSLLKLPKFDFVNKRGVQQVDNASHEDDLQTLRVKWQQKVLSSKERELYKDIANCVTDTQKKYHQWLLKEEEGSLSAEESMKKSRKSKKRQRKLQKMQVEEEKALPSQNMLFSYVEEDNFAPTAQVTVGDGSYMMMYIYADLNPPVQLVSLKWLPKQHMLLVYPDFNSLQDNPYFIEIDTDYRHLYAYAVQHESPQRPEIEAPYLELPELPPHWRDERELAAEFSMPPKRCKRFSLLFEIRDACDFEYENLHVRYHLMLPHNTILEEGLLHASTHAASADASARVHIGYSFQLTLLCDEEFDEAELLHIYFEVISIERMWERERVEGYAHYSTFICAGSDSTVLSCLRPADGFLDALARYFIGGRRKFDFVEFFSSSNAHETEFHNRFRCRMQSTGKLSIRCQRMMQRNCELLHPCTNRSKGMTLDDIMLAYCEARKRLEAVILKD